MSGITDPIADMLTRIRNACMVRHPMVSIPASNVKVALSKVLKDEGFILEYELLQGKVQPVLRIHLLYDGRRAPRIQGLKRISRPGLRTYVGKNSISKGKRQLETVILSTSAGLMAGKEARRRGIGGEVVCSVW